MSESTLRTPKILCIRDTKELSVFLWVHIPKLKLRKLIYILLRVSLKGSRKGTVDKCMGSYCEGYSTGMSVSSLCRSLPHLLRPVVPLRPILL